VKGEIPCRCYTWERGGWFWGKGEAMFLKEASYERDRGPETREEKKRWTDGCIWVGKRKEG